MGIGIKGFNFRRFHAGKSVDPLELATTAAATWTKQGATGNITSITLTTNPVVWTIKYTSTDSGYTRTLKSPTVDVSQYNHLRIAGKYSRSGSSSYNKLYIRLYNADAGTYETIRASAGTTGNFEYNVNISGINNAYIQFGETGISGGNMGGTNTMTANNITFTYE